MYLLVKGVYQSWLKLQIPTPLNPMQRDHMKKLTQKDELTEFLLYTTPNAKVKVETIMHDEKIYS